MPRSRTPKGRPQAGSRHPRNDEHRQSKSLYQSPFSIPYATISLLCHLRESRHPHNNQHSKGFTPTNQARSRTLYHPRTSRQIQKLSCTATAAQRSRKISTHHPGGCRAGKFGEGQGGLEGREPLSRGLPAPPRSFPCLPITENPHPRDKMPLRGVD